MPILISMRATPTVSYTGSISFFNGTNVYSITSINSVIGDNTIVSMNLVTASSGHSAGSAGHIYATASSSKFILNAEL